MENCQRCSKNKPSFQCTECPSFNILCTRCDKIIHNIASKQNHRRILLGHDLKEDNFSINNKNLNNSELNQIHLSNIEMENDNQNKQNLEEIEQNNEINNIDAKNNNLLISNIDNAEKRNSHNSTFITNLLIKEKYSK